MNWKKAGIKAAVVIGSAAAIAIFQFEAILVVSGVVGGVILKTWHDSVGNE